MNPDRRTRADATTNDLPFPSARMSCCDARQPSSQARPASTFDPVAVSVGSGWVAILAVLATRLVSAQPARRARVWRPAPAIHRPRFSRARASTILRCAGTTVDNPVASSGQKAVATNALQLEHPFAPAAGLPAASMPGVDSLPAEGIKDDPRPSARRTRPSGNMTGASDPDSGWVAEWFKAAVLKTAVGASSP